MTALNRRLPRLGQFRLNPKLALRLVIIPLTLGLAYYLGRNPDVSYAIFPVVAVAAWLLLRQPAMGLVAIIPAAMVVPFALGTGTGTALNIAFLMVPGLLGVWMVRQMLGRSLRLRASRMNTPVFGLVLTAAISMISGYLPWVVFAQLAPIRAQVGALAVFAFSAGAYLLTANLIDNLRWLKYMVGIFLALGAVYVISLFVPPLGFIYNYFVFGANGSMLYTWLVVLSLGQALFNRTLKLWPRLLLGGLGAATVILTRTGEFQSWASGWIPAIAAVGVLLFLRWPRLGIVAGLGAVMAVILYWVPLRSFLLEGNQYSLLTRSAAIDILLEIIKANPLLGVGPANYYYYTPLYAILGWYVRFNSHNQYLDLVAQAGLLGLLFYVWFGIAAAITGWKLRQRKLDGFASGYVNACLAGMVAVFVAGLLGDWILPFVYNVGIAGFRSSFLPWLFVGGLVAIESHLNTAERPTAPA